MGKSRSNPAALQDLAALRTAPGLLALSQAQAGGASGWLALLKRPRGGLEVRLTLDRGFAGLPSQQVAQRCASLEAAATFLEGFDPLEDRWRDGEAGEEESPLARLAERARLQLIREVYAELVGEALFTAMAPAAR